MSPALGNSPQLDAFVEIFAQRVADLVVERLAQRAPSASAAPAPLLSKAELARALGVSTCSVDRYIARGLITPTVRLGADGPARFDIARVRAALEGATSSPRPKPAVIDAAPRRLTRRAR